MYVLSGLVEGLQSPRGLAALLSYVAPSVCPFLVKLRTYWG